MPRPRTITNEQIIQTAREIFLAKGPGATTAEIASANGVSEGTIFKRFPTKKVLFLAAMAFEPPDIDQMLSARVGRGTIEDALEFLLVEVLRFYRQMIPRILMLRASGGFDPIALFKNNPEAPPLQLVHGIISYLAAEEALGRIRLRDPEPAARMLLGAAMNYAFFEVAGIPGHDRLDESEYTRQVVQQLMVGIAPEAEAP